MNTFRRFHCEKIKQGRIKNNFKWNSWANKNPAEAGFLGLAFDDLFIVINSYGVFATDRRRT